LTPSRVELGLRSETIRRANLSAIVRELHVSGALSRSKLGSRTGLSRSAIGLLTGELVSAGLVHQQSGLAVGTPGRPSAIVRLRDDGAAVLALEIAVDSLGAAIVGLGGKVLRHKRVNRPREAYSVDETVTELVALVRGLEIDSPRTPPVVGIGVALAGLVHRDDGFVAMAPNLGWHDVPLGPAIGRELGTSLVVRVANEADLGALAEHRRGSAVGVDDILYIQGEVGVGGGVIVGGRPMSGALGYGGEIGHMPLNPDGLKCGCGSRGCWETEVGERALLRLASYPAHGGREAVDALIRAARFEEPKVLGAFQHVGKWLGRGIAALTNVLNPRIVVMGGLFARLYPFVEKPLATAFAELALPASARIVSIVPASLGVDAPLLGAAELAFEALLDDPASLAEFTNPQEWRVVA
jgi:predicted NBD/HSP70 family sugar kinase